MNVIANKCNYQRPTMDGLSNVAFIFIGKVNRWPNCLMDLPHSLHVRGPRNTSCLCQAKLVKYKSEAAEGGALVEQLSAQARAEQTAARELRDSVEQLRQQTQTDKVSRAVWRLSVCWNVCGCKVLIFCGGSNN